MHRAVRPKPCMQCFRIQRPCHDQVNGRHACFDCGKAKVKCEQMKDGDAGDWQEKGKGVARRKERKAGSLRRFMREEKGKSKGKYYVYYRKIMTDH